MVGRVSNSGYRWERMFLRVRRGRLNGIKFELRVVWPLWRGCVCVYVCEGDGLDGPVMGEEFLIIPQSVFGPLVKWFPSS